jgi:hypothetical protein
LSRLVSDEELIELTRIRDGLDATSANSENRVSDERISSEIPIISENVLWSIRDAVGWIKNDEGQWISGKNKIQTRQASLADTVKWSSLGYFKTGKDNFIRYEVRDIQINKSNFYLIIKEMVDGNWASITSDKWKEQRKFKYAVFKKNGAIESLKSEGGTSFYQYSSSIYYMGEVLATDNFLQTIALDINKKISPNLNESIETTSKLILSYRLLNDRVNCRFYIDRKHSDSSDLSFDPVGVWEYNAFKFSPIDIYYECSSDLVKGLILLMKKS